jgi:hypothetical protein
MSTSQQKAIQIYYNPPPPAPNILINNSGGKRRILEWPPTWLQPCVYSISLKDALA